MLFETFGNESDTLNLSQNGIIIISYTKRTFLPEFKAKLVLEFIKKKRCSVSLLPQMTYS